MDGASSVGGPGSGPTPSAGPSVSTGGGSASPPGSASAPASGGFASPGGGAASSLGGGAPGGDDFPDLLGGGSTTARSNAPAGPADDPLAALGLAGGRQPLSEYRSIDGSGNNPIDPELGSANQPFSRLAEPAYADGRGALRGDGALPGPREVSNAVVAQELPTDSGNANDVSDLFWQWGQFVDHDLDLARENEQEEAPIAAPAGDPTFDPQGTGEREIPFDRSQSITDENGVRQQVNVLTSFLDGSQVYGSDEETARNLRTFEGGRLKTSEGDLLPLNEEGEFVAGDGRATEQPGLTAMHTVFVRAHNAIADRIAADNPGLSDEQIYQESRARIGALIQHVTYNEFLPQLLGKDALPPYRGYDPSVDPSISNEFATGAFRFGHSLVSPEVARIAADGTDLGALSLDEVFESSERIKEDGIEPYIRGQLNGEAQNLDSQIVDPLRNLLFGPPGSSGRDLAALNIQRGRDHGLPGYNDLREQLGLSRVTSFDDPVFDSEAGAKLAQVYDSPDDVDLWAGGLAENRVGGGLVGETFREIISDQFERTRAGDRFWYERQFSGDQLDAIRNTSLSDIIAATTDIEDRNLDGTALVLEDGETAATS